MPFSITLAGQDITSTVDQTTIVVESTLGQGQGVLNKTSGRATTATFTTNLGPAASAFGSGQTLPSSGGPFLVRQGEVIITDSAGRVVFGGYASKIDDLTSRTTVKTEIECTDYWQDLSRIIINEVFTGNTDTYVINYLMGKYAPAISLSLVNLSVANYTFQKEFLRAKTLQEALQHIADVTGFDMWVDPQKNLHYVAPTALGTAPFAISDTPDNIATFSALFTKYETDDTAIINRVFFYGGKHPVTTDFTQDMSIQANGNNTTFTFAYYPRESSNGKIQVLLNGVQQAVGFVLSAGAANTLISQGGTANVLINRDAQTLLWDVAPAAGATVHAIYRYETPLLVQFTNQASHDYFGRWFDGKLADNTVFDTQTALMRCRTLLVEQAYGLVAIDFTCYTPGLFAGTQIRIDNNVRNLHNTFIIQKVTATGLGFGQFVFAVEVGAWNWQLADLLLAAAQYFLPSDQSANEDTTVIQAQQSDLGLHATIAVTHATRTSGAYYARATALGDGHDAYPGMFTITS